MYVLVLTITHEHTPTPISVCVVLINRDIPIVNFQVCTQCSANYSIMSLLHVTKDK